MRTLRRNKTKLHYALFGNLVPIYSEYTDEEGNVYKIETGEYATKYFEPVSFFGNLSASGGEVEFAEFGFDIGSYEAVLITDKGLLPIDEKSRIWADTEPRFDTEGVVDEFSADYTVLAVKKSLNFDKYLLKKIVK